MSLRLYQHFLSSFLILFLVTAAQFKAVFYEANCEVLKSYYIDTAYISNDHKQITLELEHGGTVVVPFNFGFREFQITTERGFERTYIYDGQGLIQIERKVCNNSI